MIKLLLAALSGAVATIIVLFATGWAISSGAANAAAEDRVNEALKAELAPICVSQFKADADMAAHLKTLTEMDAWKRRVYVTEHGWATMPGSSGPATNLAAECADRIVKL